MFVTLTYAPNDRTTYARAARDDAPASFQVVAHPGQEPQPDSFSAYARHGRPDTFTVSTWTERGWTPVLEHIEADSIEAAVILAYRVLNG